MYYSERPFPLSRKRALALGKVIVWPYTQAHLSACYHGMIASGAVVMRSSHGPRNEDTVLLYRACCIWNVVSSRGSELLR